MTEAKQDLGGDTGDPPELWVNPALRRVVARKGDEEVTSDTK